MALVVMLFLQATHTQTHANTAAKRSHRWSQLLMTEQNRQVDFSASKTKVLKGK